METNNLLERLEKSGVDIVDFINKHKILEALPDIADLCAKSIQDDYKKANLYRHEIKYKLNPLIREADKYADYFWNKIANNNETAAIQLGELADDFMDKILTDRNLFKIKKDE